MKKYGSVKSWKNADSLKGCDSVTKELDCKSGPLLKHKGLSERLDGHPRKFASCDDTTSRQRLDHDTRISPSGADELGVAEDSYRSWGEREGGWRIIHKPQQEKPEHDTMAHQKAFKLSLTMMMLFFTPWRSRCSRSCSTARSLKSTKATSRWVDLSNNWLDRHRPAECRGDFLLHMQ